MREGDDEMTYFLLFRHAHLFLAHLSTHPEYKQNLDTKALEREVNQNLKTLDILKPRINKRYEEFRKVHQAKLAQREKERKRRAQDQARAYQQESESESPSQLRGQDHTDIAARLAGQEFSRRGSSRRAYPTGSSLQSESEDLAFHMQAIRSAIEQQQGAPTSDLDRQRQAYLENNTGYKYPEVPSNKAEKPQRQIPQPLAYNSLSAQSLAAPQLPPKPVSSQNRASTLPPRPEKISAPVIPAKAATEPTYTFAPGAQLENGTPLRNVFIPPTLRTTFLRLAYKNTLKNVETCGFLAGTLRANALFVSALVVPKQEATSDTCEMTDESELFDYVDQHNLMILGWIHTHPTQTCFMSSRDLHTHSGYQMMLAESIAIVCAPSKGDTSHGGDFGVYRLTDPPGKMAILQCEKPGIFHPHDVDNIYTDAMRPGHVMEIEGMDFEVVDLRQPVPI